MRSRRLNPGLGEVGSLRSIAITGDYTLVPYDGGTVLEVDPGGGAVTLTLPATIGPGWYCEVVVVGAGSVQFAAGPGASINSTAGATPSIATQWAGATVRSRDSAAWIVNGTIA